MVNRHPEPGSVRELRQFSLQGDGSAATVAAALACLGTRVTFVWKVSDDAFGRLAMRSLESLGVDVSFLRVAPGYVTPFAYIAVLEGPAPPVIYTTRGNVPPVTADDLPPHLLEEAALLVVDGHQPEAQVRAAEKVKLTGVPVLLVGGSAHERLGDLIALADTVICGERFATEVAPQGELEDSLAEIRAMGPDTVVITLGHLGAIAQEGDRIVRQPAFQVPVVDAIGARDVLAGAYVHALLQGWDFERRLKFATVAASLSCRALGRRASLPDKNEVLMACGFRA